MAVVDGDCNCTTHPLAYGEPRPPSASLLSTITGENDLVDIWMSGGSSAHMSVSEGSVRTARLDWIYVNQIHNRKLIRAVTSPVGFQIIIQDSRTSRYWHAVDTAHTGNFM